MTSRSRSEVLYFEVGTVLFSVDITWLLLPFAGAFSESTICGDAGVGLYNGLRDCCVAGKPMLLLEVLSGPSRGECSTTGDVGEC